MSNSAPQPPVPFQPTRQQLDELEALMRRMLDLPMDPRDAEAPTLPAPLLDAVIAPEPVAEEMALPPPGWRHDDATALFSEAVPFPAGVTLAPPEPAPAPPEPSAITTRRPRRRSTGGTLLLRPLLWSNRLFDRLTVLLGEPGRWLRSPPGRTWLGWSGLLMLATAVAWGVLDWMGWL